MIAFYFSYSLVPCVVGILLALGFIKWKWKIKLIWRIKLLILIFSMTLSSLLMQIFEKMLSSNVVAPVTIAFIITLFFGFHFRKKETDLTKLVNEELKNEQT